MKTTAELGQGAPEEESAALGAGGPSAMGLPGGPPTMGLPGGLLVHPMGQCPACGAISKFTQCRGSLQTLGELAFNLRG